MRSVAQKMPVRVMEISEEPDKKLDLTKVETVDETLKKYHLIQYTDAI